MCRSRTQWARRHAGAAICQLGGSRSGSCIGARESMQVWISNMEWDAAVAFSVEAESRMHWSEGPQKTTRLWKQSVFSFSLCTVDMPFVGQPSAIKFHDTFRVLILVSTFALFLNVQRWWRRQHREAACQGCRLRQALAVVHQNQIENRKRLQTTTQLPVWSVCTLL